MEADMKNACTARRRRVAPLLVLAICGGLLVSACGGSSDSGTPLAATDDPAGGQPVAEGDNVPSEASSSVASMLAWVKSLGASETAQPYRLDNFRPPLDDTTETSPG
jgi:hypothetical protein